MSYCPRQHDCMIKHYHTILQHQGKELEWREPRRCRLGGGKLYTALSTTQCRLPMQIGISLEDHRCVSVVEGGRPFAGGGVLIVRCLSAYSLTMIEQLTSWHNFFLLTGGSRFANSNPLARSNASIGTSKSCSGLSLAILSFGRTNAPRLTFPPTLPSSAKMTL